MARIPYTNKTTAQTSPLPAEQKWTSGDANVVKESVNALYDADAATAGEVMFNDGTGVGKSGDLTFDGALQVGADSDAGQIQLGGATGSAVGTVSSNGTLTMEGEDVVVSGGNSVELTTNAVSRLKVDADGTWLVEGSAGASNQVLKTNGAGAPPEWAAIEANDVSVTDFFFATVNGVRGKYVRVAPGVDLWTLDGALSDDNAIGWSSGVWFCNSGSNTVATSTDAVATPVEVTSWTGSATVVTEQPLYGPTVQDALEQLAGSATQLTGNTIWVDAVYGNDTTGEANRPDRPFLTLNAAQAVGGATDTIVVRPGTYDERVILNDVNWHFENGAVLDYTGTSTGQAFGDDLATAATCRVTGWGVFRHSGLTDLLNPVDDSGPYNGVVGSINENSDWYFECLRIEGDQQQDVGSGGLVIDCGKLAFGIKDTLSSTIYDALLIAGEVNGASVFNGSIANIATSATADNAIEAPSSVASGYVKIGNVVHLNTDVQSINGIGNGIVIDCAKISGGSVNVTAGNLINCEVVMQNTNSDPLSYPLLIGNAGSNVGRISNCRIVQEVASEPAILITGSGGCIIDKCTVVAGSGATESISSTSPVTIVSYASYANVAVDSDVTVDGLLTVGAYVQ